MGPRTLTRFAALGLLLVLAGAPVAQASSGRSLRAHLTELQLHSKWFDELRAGGHPHHEDRKHGSPTRNILAAADIPNVDLSNGLPPEIQDIADLVDGGGDLTLLLPSDQAEYNDGRFPTYTEYLDPENVPDWIKSGIGAPVECMSNGPFTDPITGTTFPGCRLDEFCNIEETVSIELAQTKVPSNTAGKCVSCWECCLAPELHADCDFSRCRCGSPNTDVCQGVEAEVANPLLLPFPTSDCGSGEFCKRSTTSTMNGQCASCASCLTDADVFSADGSLARCADWCVSGAIRTLWGDALLSRIGTLLGVPTIAYVSHAVYDWNTKQLPEGTAHPLKSRGDDLSSLDFCTATGSTAACPFSVSVDDMGDLLHTLGLRLDGEQVAFVFQNMAARAGDASRASDREIVESLALAVSIETLMCPTIAGGLGTNPPARTFTGCPCNARWGAEVGRCPAGSTCSRVAFNSMPRELLGFWTASTATGAICAPCELGAYCPEGSVEVEMLMSAGGDDCPPGSFCPTPAERYDCPTGTYCIERSTSPHSCNYTTLLARDPRSEVVLPRQSVIQRLYDGGDPLGGNFCEANSTVPSGLCPGSYYCPSVSEKFLCPAGSYCPEQSMEPVDCPFLARCPEGSEKPTISGVAIINIVLAVFSVFIPATLRFLRFKKRALLASAAADDAAPDTETSTEAIMRFRTIARKVIKGASPGAALGADDGATVTDILSRDPAIGEQIAQLSPEEARELAMFTPLLRLEFMNMEFELKDKKRKAEGKATIITGITGHFKAGEVCAIMGSSGCGKSTFLNVLSGRADYGYPSGTVKINYHKFDSAVYAFKAIRNITGFVPQDDVVFNELTVMENLRFSAYLRLRKPKEIDCPLRVYAKASVQRTLQDLGLTHVANTVVGDATKRGVSGGQRKRVNIGMEVACAPSILFMDEPTSGLDASSSVTLMDMMRNLAKNGMCIVTVIHQPRFSIFSRFHKLMLLGPGGRLVYMGPPTMSRTYFGDMLGFQLDPNENLADSVLDILSGKVNRKRTDPENPKRSRVDVFDPTGLSDIWKGTAAGEICGMDVMAFHQLNAQTDAGETSEVTAAVLGVVLFHWDRLDVDGSGTLETPELVELFTSMGLLVNADDVELMLSDMNVPAGKGLSKEMLFDMLKNEGDEGDEEGRAKLLGSKSKSAQMQDAMDEIAERRGEAGAKSSKSSKGLMSGLMGTRQKGMGALSSVGDAVMGLGMRSPRRGSKGADRDADDDPVTRWISTVLHDWAQQNKIPPHEVHLRFGSQFDRHDVDRNGELDHDEIHMLFRALKINVPGNQLQALVEILDTDGNGSVSKSELMSRIKVISESGKLMDAASIAAPPSAATLISPRTGIAAEHGRTTRGADRINLYSETESDSDDSDADGGRSVREGALGSALAGGKGEEAAAPAAREGKRSFIRRKSEQLVAKLKRRDTGESDAGTPGPTARGGDLSKPAAAVGRRSADGSAFHLRLGSVSNMGAAGAAGPAVLKVRNWARIQDGLGPSRLDFFSYARQTLVVARRLAIMRYREFNPVITTDVSLLTFAALIVGYIHGQGAPMEKIPPNTAMAMAVLAVLTTVTFLKTFSTPSHRLLFKRERRGGLHTVAYFCACTGLDMFYVVMWPLLFIVPYWSVTLNPGTWNSLYFTTLLIVWWVSGVSYLLSSLIPPSNVLVSGMFIVLIMGAFFNGLNPSIASERGGFGEWLISTSFNRWATEILVINDYSARPDHMSNIAAVVGYQTGICHVDERYAAESASLGDTGTGNAILSDAQLSSLEALSADFDVKESCAQYINEGWGVLFAQGAAFRLASLLAMIFYEPRF